MYALLLTLLVLDGLFLSVVILLQAGKGGGLAAMGGGAAATEGILGGRQATTVLTRATWISGTAFMVLAMILAILSSRSQTPQSILRQGVTPAGAPAPVLPESSPVLPGTPEAAPPEGTTPPPQEDGDGA